MTISSPLQLGADGPQLHRLHAPPTLSAYNTRTADFNNIPTPYAAQWNFSLQYALQQDLLVEAAYSGKKGTKLVTRGKPEPDSP